MEFFFLYSLCTNLHISALFLGTVGAVMHHRLLFSDCSGTEQHCLRLEHRINSIDPMIIVYQSLHSSHFDGSSHPLPRFLPLLSQMSTFWLHDLPDSEESV